MVVPQTFGWPYGASELALPLDRGNRRSSGPAVEPTFGGADVVRTGDQKGKPPQGSSMNLYLRGGF